MMKRLGLLGALMSVILLTLLMAPTATPTHSQGPMAWSLWVFDGSTNEIIQMNPDTNTLTRLGVTFPRQYPPKFIGQLSLSPDGTTFAYCSTTARPGERGDHTLVFYDWQAQTVVSTYAFTNIENCFAGPLSWAADSSQVVVNLVTYFYSYFGENPAETRPPFDLYLMDVASGQPARILTDSMGPQFESFDYLTAEYLQKEQFVVYQITGFKGPAASFYWDLTSNATLRVPTPNVAVFGANNELSFPNYNDNFPRMPVAGIGDFSGNTAAVWNFGTTTDLFYDSQDSIYSTAYAANGQYLLINSAFESYFLNRQGNLSPYPLVNPYADFYTTPNGVIAVEQTDFLLFNVNYYVPNNPAPTQLFSASTENADYAVIGVSPLPETQPLPTFPAQIQRTDAGPECAGLPVPRLRIGIQGIVADTTANRVRATPSLGAQEVASIPPNGIFTVLGGPTCADGYVWWQVEYNGQVGWTAEGDSSKYWLSWLRP